MTTLAPTTLSTTLAPTTTCDADNDFSNDDNCVSLYRFEYSALTVDSKGSNTLTNSGMASSYTHKEGCGSALSDALSDRFYRTDSNLSSDFPFKDSGGIGTISVCGWVYINGLPTTGSRYILGKWSTSQKSWLLYINCSDNNRFYIGNSPNTAINSGLSVQTGRWYHYGLVLDNTDKSYRLRIWDDTAGALLGTVSGNYSSNITDSDTAFNIGAVGGGNFAAGAYRDEIVIFKDVLTNSEIDAIRSGTYSHDSTTSAPTTEVTTVAPTTEITTISPTTIITTLAPTTISPTTIVPTTISPTTLPPTTLATTTISPTTVTPTTIITTQAPTTVVTTTLAPTTIVTTSIPTTLPPTTITPTTEVTTIIPTTIVPTTITTTLAPTTLLPTTLVPTTLAPTTLTPTTITTTLAPTTTLTTTPPTTAPPSVPSCGDKKITITIDETKVLITQDDLKIELTIC